MEFLLYYLLKPFKKLQNIHYFQIILKEKKFNIYKYEILGKDEFILTNKKITDYAAIRIIKYKKYKNYYIV